MFRCKSDRDVLGPEYARKKPALYHSVICYAGKYRQVWARHNQQERAFEIELQGNGPEHDLHERSGH
jgi:hypothetical protein